MSVKVLGVGCASCHEQYEQAKAAVKSMGLDVEVEYITDLQKVVGYGAMSMPALVVNEKVVAMGKVLKAADVDLHCFEYTGEGEILYEGDCFPIETFSGKGKIEEIEVSCIEPYSQVMFHLGYEFDENDVHDVKLLCETFHIEIPNEYR